jgi:tetratricopeptide (TPR) repeat protein
MWQPRPTGDNFQAIRDPNYRTPRAGPEYGPGVPGDDGGGPSISGGPGSDPRGPIAKNLSNQPSAFTAYSQGKAAYLRKDFAGAVVAYERSLAIRPDNPEGRFELGMSYAQLGRYPDAEKAFAAALQLRPDDVRTRYELGKVLFTLGRRSDAAAQFRRAVELDPAGDLGEQSRNYLDRLK